MAKKTLDDLMKEVEEQTILDDDDVLKNGYEDVYDMEKDEDDEDDSIDDDDRDFDRRWYGE